MLYINHKYKRNWLVEFFGKFKIISFRFKNEFFYNLLSIFDKKPEKSENWL